MREPRGRGSRDTQASLPPALCLSLLSVCCCGHADSFFFLELGRSAPTAPWELWLQVPDTVVAQSIHETVLAAMKRLGDGGTVVRLNHCQGILRQAPPDGHLSPSLMRPQPQRPHQAARAIRGAWVGGMSMQP